MGNEFVAGLHIVRVIDGAGADRTTILYAAATPVDQAVEAVRQRVGAGKVVELADQRVTKELAGRLKLRPGDVCEISSGV